MNGLSVPSRRWYREPWPWLLMLPPLASVVGGVTMVYLAVGVSNPLVVDDYARIEEITRDRFAAEESAADLDVRARVTFAPAAEGRVDVLVEIEGGEAFAAPAEIRLRLRHAAYEAADRTLTLGRATSGYAGSTTLADGRYALDLGPPGGAWLLSGAAPQGAGTLALAGARSAGRE